MAILVDSSIWISYFRESGHEDVLDYLIDENLLVTNELILAELIPFLKRQNKQKLIRLLNQIKKLPLRIDWEGIISIQTKCLKEGISGIGIPDLIIAQNAIDNLAQVLSEDKHFLLLQKVTQLSLYRNE